MEVSNDQEYDDEYGTCHHTSACFRIWHVDLEPTDISCRLNLSPSWAHRRGEPRSSPKGTLLSPYKVGTWALDTVDVVRSRDLRRHLDWLLDRLEPVRATLEQLQQDGYSTDIFCNWVRLGGSGGPTISPRNMTRLGRLNLELGFEWWSEDDR